MVQRSNGNLNSIGRLIAREARSSGREHRLTSAQMKALRGADVLGRVKPPYSNNGLTRANWNRMMQRMVPTYVMPYYDGEYELTAEGTRVSGRTP